MNIKTITQTEREWSISKKMQQSFNKESIEKILSAIDLIGGFGSYIMDYHAQKIFVSSESSSILCGHPKELIDNEGFNFFKRIMSPKELAWLSCANKASYDVFFDTPFTSRKKLIFSFDLTCATTNQREIILHHKVVPFQLCNNGNVWLSLCSVTSSYQKKSRQASLFNTKTGDRYKFIDNRFDKIPDCVLTEEELRILDYMVKGFHTDEISTLLKVSSSNIKHKKREMYKKMGVKTSAEAIHWVHLEGFF